MEIEEIQDRVTEFETRRSNIKKYQISEELILIHLMEEVGELSSQIINKKARPDKYDKENMKEEVCDIILISLHLAKVLDINLSEELINKLDILDKRLDNTTPPQ